MTMTRTVTLYTRFTDCDYCCTTGNEYLHLLTTGAPARTYTLRIDLADFDGETRYAQYSGFRISSEEDKYRLEYEGETYEGDAGLLLFSR